MGEPIGMPKPPNTTCTKLGSLDQCAQCRSDDQCQSGKCHGYSKLCTSTKWWGRKRCYGAKAYCIKDRCRNADYPEKWGQPTCQKKSEEKVPDTKDTQEEILPEEVGPTDENGPEEDSTDENTPEEDPIDENTPEEDSTDQNTPDEDPIDENVPEEDLTDEDGSLDGDEGDEFTDGELSTDLSDETEKDDS